MSRASGILNEIAKTKYNSLSDDELLKVFRKNPKDPDTIVEITKRGLQDHPLIRGLLKGSSSK